MLQNQSDIKPLVLAIVVVATLSIMPCLPMQANTRTETSCGSTNGRFSHPDNQRCQTRRPYRRGR